MDENLQRLAQDLRKETCPRRVADEVARRIAAQRPLPRHLRVGIAGALASLVLLCGVAVWRWPAGDNLEKLPKRAGRASVDAAQIAAQAERALGCIGAVLRDAGARSEQIVLKGAVPPLRNSLDTTINKLIDHL